MTEIEQKQLKFLAYQTAKNFRDKHKLENYCAEQLLNIIDKLKKTEKVDIKVIRTPLQNIKLSGFIGYKKDTFVIVTNTNHKFGSERFTIAHEIYHLLNNRVNIKTKSVIEEDECINNEDDINEIMANAFASELLMPKDSVEEDVRLITKKNSEIDESIVVQLQQKYGVSYVAMAKRLNEIGLIDNTKKDSLEKLSEEDLEKLTKNLGYTNELNIPSRSTYLNPEDLQNIRVNYQNDNITYDDLIRIFSYLGSTPDKFGYEEKEEISDEALNFMKALL